MRIPGSILFNLFYFSWSLFIVAFAWVLIPFPARIFRRGIALWPRGTNLALRIFCGIEFEIRGRENLPGGAVIFAVKHQSAWETMYFLQFDPDVAYSMKSELLRIPFWRWYINKAVHISLDRAGGMRALKSMIRDTQKILDAGRSVVVFPEGTRTRPGERGEFHPGIAALYSRIDVPIVPVALNSGLFWGRRSFIKRPGKILLEFLAPVPSGLDRPAFMADLQDRIESAARRLEDEARG